MDFFAHQDAARKKTSLLVFYFGGAVVLIILAVYLAALFTLFLSDDILQRPLAEQLWNPAVLAGSAAGTLLVICLGSLYKFLTLRRGGPALAETLGGTPINPGSQDLQERRLLNIVEEMAIASGTPVPDVYVLRQESSINAFAAGHTPADAVIGITQGGLDNLSRDELQGVIAHEFSHILNGDMALNLRLMGILHGILLLGLAGRATLRSLRYSGSHYRASSRSGKKGGGPIVLFGLALFVIGYIGVFFANLIKAGISRQREFLADASAVQFTRNPAGIAGALKKIGGLTETSLRAPTAEQASHLYFTNGLAKPLLHLLATHPPLIERIRRIDASFVGQLPEARSARPAGASESAVVAAGFAGRPDATPGPVPASATATDRIGARPQTVIDQAGAPQAAHLDFAGRFIEQLPANVTAAAREPFGARAVVYGLLMSQTVAVRQHQFARLKQYADPPVMRELSRLLPHLKALPPMARLPLAELTLPALHTLSDAQYPVFRENVVQLITADRRITLFEFALQRVVLRHLDDRFGTAPVALSRRRPLERLTVECALLLSALAYAGHGEATQATGALRAGLEQLGLAMVDAPLPREAIGLDALGNALDQLALLKPLEKRRLLAACSACSGWDGTVTVSQAELLRAVAGALAIPLPPLLEPGSRQAGSSGAAAVEHDR